MVTCHLGLDKQRMRNANAMGQQWGLVGVTSSRLHRDGLPPSTTQGGGRGPTLRRSCRQQTQSLSQALILYAYERPQLGHGAAERLASLCTQHQLVTTRCAFVSIRPPPALVSIRVEMAAPGPPLPSCVRTPGPGTALHALLPRRTI